MSVPIQTGLNPDDIPAAHQAFFRRHQLYHIDSENRLFVHAGLNRDLDFFRQPPGIYKWDRSLRTDALAWQSAKDNTQPFKK